MKVWILQTGEPLHIDGGTHRPMRAMNLADALTAAGHHVTLWSSEFFHQEKRQRGKEFRRVTVSPLLCIRLVPSPGYQRNIGFARLVDHAVLAVNLRRELSHEQVPPDVAFIGYPPIEVATVMARWLSRRSVPCLLDMKDQWPQLFIDALPPIIRPLGRLVFFPYYLLAKRAMRDVSGLTAMADTFLDWGRQFSGRPVSQWDRVVPLTLPPSQLTDDELGIAREGWDGLGVRNDHCVRISFVGTHSPAFDIEPVVAAANYFAASGRPYQIVMCGNGPDSVRWQARLKKFSSVIFPGWVDRAQIQTLAERSIASLAPYKNTENFKSNIPNKVVDALSLGLPILSPLDGEVAKLIRDHKIGVSYGGQNEVRLEQAMERIADDAMFRQKCVNNSLNLYRSRFGYEQVYGGLVRHLASMFGKGT